MVDLPPPKPSAFVVQEEEPARTHEGNGHAQSYGKMANGKVDAMGGTIPDAVLKAVLPHYKRDDIAYLLAEETLTGMVKAYQTDAARTEHAFSAMYKKRETTHWGDIEERESVAKDMHRERFQARAFLRDVRDGMKAYRELTPEQSEAFDMALMPPRQRNNGAPKARG